jgi:hypothetical protein
MGPFDLAVALRAYGGAIQLREKERERRRMEKERLLERIERARSRLERLEGTPLPAAPGFERVIIGPIAAELQRRFPDFEFEVLGPFGLGSEYGIHAKVRLGEGEKFDWDAHHVGGITLRPGRREEGELRMKDYSKDTGRHPPGSLGQINGLNHPDVYVTSFEQVVQAFEDRVREATAHRLPEGREAGPKSGSPPGHAQASPGRDP